MKRILSYILTLSMLLTLAACGGNTDTPTDSANEPVTHSSRYDDTPAKSADVSALYPDAVHIDVSAPAGEGITVSHDIVYYEAGHDFTYGEGTAEDEHSAEEAEAHTVITVTEAGTYVLSGTLERGQIAVDLGKDAEDDPEAVVTLVLNGLDITCTVAPAVIFYNVYECGSTDAEDATYTVDTSAAGANVIIPDGSVNHVRGSYVARIYKSVELNDAGTEVIDSKKLHKYDAAFYSKMSMNVDGGADNSGVLNIVAENEGLDTELHLTVNGGTVRITAGNDGINTNEDEVSVTTVNGGTVDITCSGATGEGDGIDSNGWLVINGGTVYAQACATSADAGIDSDMGIYLNGGTVMASGNMLDKIAGGSATYAVFTFAQPVEGGKAVWLKDADGAGLAMYSADNAFRYLVLSVNTMTEGDYTLWLDDVQLAHGGAMSGGKGFGDRDGFGGQRPEGFEGMERPENFDPAQMQRPDDMGERPEPPDGMERPEGMTPPEGEGGFGGRGGMPAGGERSAVFTIVKGGNQFGGIGEYTAEA